MKRISIQGRCLLRNKTLLWEHLKSFGDELGENWVRYGIFVKVYTQGQGLVMLPI